MAAKMIAVQDLKPGDVLADAVLSIGGKTLLGRDIKLTSRHIHLFETWDIRNVFVNVAEELSADTAPPVAELIPPLDSKLNSSEYLEFVKQHATIVKNIAGDFDIVRKMKIIPVSHMKTTVDTIHLSLSTYSFEIMNYLLLEKPQLTDFISHHSVMVAYFSGLIARQLKWTEADVTGVMLAGLLHDIGNLMADKITDLRVQSHIAEAAGLLKRTKGLSPEVILGIVQHRERANGSGFPTKAQGIQIHPYAKVVAVADFFHNFAYTDQAVNPFSVLDALAVSMFDKFDMSVCMAFLNQAKDSLLSNNVILSDGQIAQIVLFHPENYSLPIIKTQQGQFIDLLKTPNFRINRIMTSSEL